MSVESVVYELHKARKEFERLSVEYAESAKRHKDLQERLSLAQGWLETFARGVEKIEEAINGK